MRFAQLPQSGAYWSVLPVRSLLPSFRSLRYILLPLLLRNCALYTPLNCTIPSPVRFISLRFCFIQSFPHFTSTTSRAPPHRLSATCRPPRSLSFKMGTTCSMAERCLRVLSFVPHSHPPRPGRHGGGGGRSTHPFVVPPPSCVALATKNTINVTYT